MILRRTCRLALGVIITIGGTSARATAQGWYVGPYFGTTSHARAAYGDFRSDLLDETTFGVTGGLTGKVGAEVDFGYTPDFFGYQDVTRRKNHVLTLTGAAILSKPIHGARRGRIRPYLAFGGGLFRVATGAPNPEKSTTGLAAGGGVTSFLRDRIGVRGDVRYLRALSGDNRINFWRLSIGMILVHQKVIVPAS